jgi:hypothetical protein
LGTIGDTVNISATKEGVKFSVQGDTGSGTIVCKQGTASDDKEEESVQIKMEEEVSLTFAVRYLNSFAKVCCVLCCAALCVHPLSAGVLRCDAGHSPVFDGDSEDVGRRAACGGVRHCQQR